MNIQVKSATSKAKWLMEIASNDTFKVNLGTFTTLLGTQKGNYSGRDLIFMDKGYISRILRTDNAFYKEAFSALALFNRMKGIATPSDWDNENIFYNPLILSRTGKTLKETEYFRSRGIFKLGQLLEEKSKEALHFPYDRTLVNLVDHIILNVGTMDLGAVKDDLVFLGNGDKLKMIQITQKDLYEDAILSKSVDHVHQIKWAERLNELIVWEEVWSSVHDFLLSNSTKTAIWEQLHLNFYTQYSYNKWHSEANHCPLCDELPADIFHIITDCPFVNELWTHIQPTLLKLYGKPLDDGEKSLGIVHIKRSPGIMLRNWVGYKLREEILLLERRAYHSSQAPSIDLFKAKFNQSLAREVRQFIFRFTNEGNLKKFDEILTFKGILCEKVAEEDYRIKPVFL